MKFIQARRSPCGKSWANFSSPLNNPLKNQRQIIKIDDYGDNKTDGRDKNYRCNRSLYHYNL